MRSYMGVLNFSNKSLKKKEYQEFLEKEENNNFSLLYNISPNDFKIFKNEKFTFLIDGEVYDNNYEYSFNNELFISDVWNEYLLHNDESIFNKLNGSFNVLIYSHENEYIYVIKDRFSTRPLYYYKGSDYFVFSNQMSNIIKNFNRKEWEIDYDSVHEFLKIQMILGSKTYITDIKAFENATFSLVKEDKIREIKYWEFQHSIKNKYSKKEHSIKISLLMKKILEYKTSDKKKYGIFMSGGMDSRGVLAADNLRKISHVFTIGDSLNLECRIAKDIAKVHKSDFYFLKRSENYYYDIISKSVNLGDGMYNYLNGHFINHSEKVSDKVDVVFNGSLIEQMWQGTKFINPKFKFLNMNIKLPLAINYKKNNNTVNLLLKHFPRKVNQGELIFVNKTKSIEVIKNSISQRLRENFGEEDRPIQEAMDYLASDSYGRYSSHLNQLCINDAMTYRTIYDNNLIDLLLETPINYRVSGKLLRNVIIRLYPELSKITFSNTGIKLSKSVAMHWLSSNVQKLTKKIGKSNKENSESWPNYAELICENEFISQKMKEIIYDSTILNPEIFDIDYIKELFSNHLNRNENNERVLFLILTYGQWYKSIKAYLKE